MDVTPTIRAPRDSAARTAYLEYLQTASWRITRNRALWLAGYRCQRCAGKRDLDVHHKTYERLGHEWDQDLEVVCRTCHDQHHELEKARVEPSIRLYLKLVSGALWANPSLTVWSDIAEVVKQECARLRIPYDSERVGRAMSMVMGKRPASAPPCSPAELVDRPWPINRAEAYRLLVTLAAQRLRINIREMPAVGDSPIDIYGPPPSQEWGAHDRY